MSQGELVENLGTIARSGTRAFLERARLAQSSARRADRPVRRGFYSSFIVADRVVGRDAPRRRRGGLALELGRAGRVPARALREGRPRHARHAAPAAAGGRRAGGGVAAGLSLDAQLVRAIVCGATPTSWPSRSRCRPRKASSRSPELDAPAVDARQGRDHGRRARRVLPPALERLGAAARDDPPQGRGHARVHGALVTCPPSARSISSRPTTRAPRSRSTAARFGGGACDSLPDSARTLLPSWLALSCAAWSTRPTCR
jgi:hypothetical protein